MGMPAATTTAGATGIVVGTSVAGTAATGLGMVPATMMGMGMIRAGRDDGDDSGWDDGSYWDEGWSDSGSDYDWCAEAGYYGDGVCDSGCPCSDPDCWE